MTTGATEHGLATKIPHSTQTPTQRNHSRIHQPNKPSQTRRRRIRNRKRHQPIHPHRKRQHRTRLTSTTPSRIFEKGFLAAQNQTATKKTPTPHTPRQPTNSTTPQPSKRQPPQHQGTRTNHQQPTPAKRPKHQNAKNKKPKKSRTSKKRWAHTSTKSSTRKLGTRNHPTKIQQPSHNKTTDMSAHP